MKLYPVTDLLEQISADGKKVVGWDALWDPNRPFAMDVAGFAVNLGLFASRPRFTANPAESQFNPSTLSV